MLSKALRNGLCHNQRSKMKMMKLPMCCFLLASAVATAQTFSVNLGGENSAASNAEAAASDEVKSLGRGVGVNETEALKDAYRDAIERAIGLYVDAETVAKNDEIVKDQILTQSNAYITRYDRVKTSKMNGGLVEVKIVAWIKKRALTKKIADAMPGVTTDVSGSLGQLHAQVTTKESRNRDGAALLANALNDMDLTKMLLRVSLGAENPVVVKAQREDRRCGRMRRRGRQEKEDDGKIRLGYLFNFEIDKDRYFKDVLPQFKRIMDQISLTSPKTIRFNTLGEERIDRNYISHRNDYLNAGEKFEDKLHTMSCTTAANGNLGFYDQIKCFATSFPGCRRELELVYGNAGTLGFDQDAYLEKGLVAVLITDVNAGGIKGIRYTLDFEAARVLNKWHSKHAGASRRSGKQLQYDILFKDGNGDEVLAHSWNFNHKQHGSGGGCGVCWNACFVRIPLKEKWEGRDEKAPEQLWILTPFIGGCAERYVEWHAFDLNKDDLAKIKQISIERVEQ